MNFSLVLCLITALAASASALPKSRKIDIELVHRLLVEDQVRQGRILFWDIHRVEEALCDLVCPAGSTIVSNPENVPDINGCGSYNINIDFSIFNMEEFNLCCNVHDACYEDCFQTQKTCDDSFGTCLTSTCDRWAIEQNWGSIQKFTCKSVANIMKLAVQTLGCKAYKDSKVKACKCV